MLPKIRYGTFETNSSSTHTVSLTGGPARREIPKIVAIADGVYAFEGTEDELCDFDVSMSKELRELLNKKVLLIPEYRIPDADRYENCGHDDVLNEIPRMIFYILNVLNRIGEREFAAKQLLKVLGLNPEEWKLVTGGQLSGTEYVIEEPEWSHGSIEFVEEIYDIVKDEGKLKKLLEKGIISVGWCG